MLISIQYPFADARSFIAGDGGRLTFPHWATPDSETEFVRGFGGISVRRLGGASVGGEHRHCDAQWAVRFSKPGLGHDRYCAVRRFYSDGNAFAKFELGIAHRVPREPLVATAQ